jgi:hypothetical protein
MENIRYGKYPLPLKMGAGPAEKEPRVLKPT